MSSVGYQYAKALFDLGKENNKLNEFKDYLNCVKVLMSDKQTMSIFQNPNISKKERIDIVYKSFKDYFDELFINFLCVLIEHNRMVDIDEINDSYVSLIKEENKIVNATVYQNYELTKEQLNLLINILEKKYNKQVLIKTVVDDNLVGGIKVVVDDEVIDASLFKDMQKLKNDLKKGW